jgi:hypothetical protein
MRVRGNRGSETAGVLLENQLGYLKHKTAQIPVPTQEGPYSASILMSAPVALWHRVYISQRNTHKQPLFFVRSVRERGDA